MSDTATPDEGQPPISPEASAIAYVRGNFFPPLPAAYGLWLVELASQAEAGARPELEMPIPDAIKETGVIPKEAYTAEDGTLVITLGAALSALHQSDLLLDEEAEDDDEASPLELVTPIVALALANTADAAYWGRAYDPERIHELAAALTLGEWEVHTDDPIRVDEQGRVVSGLNELLAIVSANTDAPVAITYAYDNGPRPLTWRGPAGAERNPENHG